VGPVVDSGPRFALKAGFGPKPSFALKAGFGPKPSFALKAGFGPKPCSHSLGERRWKQLGKDPSWMMLLGGDSGFLVRLGARR
jgi:hypothetical protein